MRAFSRRPLGRVLMGAGLVAGAGLLIAGTGGTAAAAAPAAMVAQSATNTAGIWKALGITAIAVGYIYGQIQVGLALSRNWENRQRQKDAEAAKAKARDEKIEELKKKLHGDKGDAKDAEPKEDEPPKAPRRRRIKSRLPQPA
ncbi:MAG: hypothetical protein Alpg2KO_04530 [Alphaproteobacteria bacterium]